MQNQAPSIFSVGWALHVPILRIPIFGSWPARPRHPWPIVGTAPCVQLPVCAVRAALSPASFCRRSSLRRCAVCGLVVLVLPVAPFLPSPSCCTTDPYAIDPPGHLQLFPLAHLNCGRPCNTRPRLAADPHRDSRPRHSMTEGMWLWLGTMREAPPTPCPQRARFALIRASRCSNLPRQLPFNVSRILGTGEICPSLSL